jgi:hypothetical protein
LNFGTLPLVLSLRFRRLFGEFLAHGGQALSLGPRIE